MRDAMTVDIHTFGCRLNTLESETIRRCAAGADLSDLVVVNTCAVTAEAVRQARQAIRKAKRENPGARLVVTGCAAQIEPQSFLAMPEVDRVLGNAEKLAPAAWAETARVLAGGASGDGAASDRAAVGDIMAAGDVSPAPIEGMEGRTRAFVQVQTGCDHRCTFCVIPYGRGRSRSVPAGEAVAQARRLVANGYREIVLTGVDLTSYGADLPDRMTLGRLVQAILASVPDLPRLRLSSIDCIEADDDLFDAFAREPRLMPHLHLSLQAGDDLVLKRMKRRHLRADAVAFCAALRRLRPDIAFGADLIAGFPTETEDMFTRSLELVEECGLAFLHVFPFSARPGTPAERMPQMPREIVKERARRLREKGEAALRAHLDREVGRNRLVLVETSGTARTEQFTEVRLNTPHAPGAIAGVGVIGHDGRRLIAA
jgi:threonylcarbamoyladenosine tRNA methylthiotransferase MtaB